MGTASFGPHHQHCLQNLVMSQNPQRFDTFFFLYFSPQLGFCHSLEGLCQNQKEMKTNSNHVI